MSPESTAEKLNNPYLLVCNGSPPAGDGRRGTEWAAVPPRILSTRPGTGNVTLRIADISDAMAKRLSQLMEDLVELSALVYAADQCCPRLGGWKFDYGKKWYRTFRFEVAVREPKFWNRPDVIDALRNTLGFLSDDHYEFAFTQYIDPPDFGDYLDFNKDAEPPAPPERVMLFSGGLDSLAGAAEEVLVHQRRVALVSHKPVDHLAARQRDLVDDIRRRARTLRPNLAPLHVAVKANKVGELSLDNTQRSRSFLYAAVAEVYGLGDIHFYENGIVSVNLPLCGQEVGGRATRTTHPQVLTGLGRLFSLVLGRDFAVRNEYQWDTKEDVLRRLLKTGHADLSRQSFSCVHTRMSTLPAPHCGLCSQCLSRWIASLGAEYGDDDPARGYHVPVLVGERKKDEERILAERFIGWARRVEQMSTADEFNLAFAGELARVSPFVGLPEQDAVARLFDLHFRHSVQVGRAIKAPMLEHVPALYEYRLPDTCVLAYAFDRTRYVDPVYETAKSANAPAEALAAPPPAVVLGDEDVGPVVLNKPKPKLNPAPYRVVKALIEAKREGRDRLTGPQLDKKAGCCEARKHLANLRDTDPDWAKVLLFPKGKGRGYGIR